MNDVKKALNIHLVKPSQIMELSSSRTPSTMRNSRQYSLRMLQIAQSLLSMAITMLSILPGLRAHVADTRYLGFLVDMHLLHQKASASIITLDFMPYQFTVAAVQATYAMNVIPIDISNLAESQFCKPPILTVPIELLEFILDGRPTNPGSSNHEPSLSQAQMWRMRKVGMIQRWTHLWQKPVKTKGRSKSAAMS